MIQKFKRKTILILTMIFWVILVGILLTINLLNAKSNQSETKKLLDTQMRILELSDVKNPKLPEDQGQKLTRIYSVTVDEEQEYHVVFSTDEVDFSEEELIEIAKDIFAEAKKEGILKNFRYKVSTTDEGAIISFMDNSNWEHQQYRMMVYSIIICISGMVILFFVAIVLTRWLIKPVITAFDKQRQFISDAGHELKTPVTVMKASLDMLEGGYGDNKYFGYIREENNRMTELIYELLSLSKLENAHEKSDFQRIDLSRIVEGTCLPFECLAFEKGIHLELQIQDEIYLSCIEKEIRQLIEVLVDNAIKHTKSNGTVVIQLNKDKGKTVLRVKNEGEPIPEAQRSKIFDRFYRGDQARCRSEGRYGLGLAIAQSIVEMHKSKILVECKDNWTIFSVKFN